MVKKIFQIVIFGWSVVLASPPPALIEVEFIKEGVLNPLQNFIGTVTLDKKSILASESFGLVNEVNFEVGDDVKKGKVLIQIDSKLLDAKMQSFTANLEIAKIKLNKLYKDFLRYKKLIESNSVTQQEFDRTVLEFTSDKQNVLSLKAQLKELKIQKKQKVVTAPFDGVIIEKNVNIGEWAQTGSSVGTLVDTSSADVIFNLPENLVLGLEDKRLYTIHIGHSILKAKFHSIIPKGDKLTRTFPVKFKIKIEDRFIFDGQEALISLPRKAKIKALIIHRDAVIKRFGNDVVFVNNKGVALMIPVKILGYLKENIAISGKGLNKGMSVVVKGNERVFPNQAVQVINKQLFTNKF